MGRKRKVRRELPERVYFQHGAYYFVTPEKRWIRLDSNFIKAMSKWAEIIEVPDKTKTMGDIIDRYMIEVAPTKAPKTYRENIKQVKNLKAVFGHMSPDEIKPPDVYGYLDIRGKNAPISANREKSLLSHILTMAIRWGLTEKNPCRFVVRLKEKKRDRYLTDAEFILLRSVASLLIKCIMDLAYVTALRRGDILKIRLSDFKNDGLHVEIGKTGKRMVFEWTSDLKEVIARVKSLKRPIKSVYLFCNRKGQKYTDDGFNSLWQRVKKRVDIEDIHFHDIRAKSLTDAKRQGRDAQLMAGHKSSSMTDHYVKQREVERVPPLKLIGGQG